MQRMHFAYSFLQKQHNKLPLTSVMRTWCVDISMTSWLLEGGSAASKACLQAPSPFALLKLQVGKTFCASFCASLIAGSRREFSVCWLLEFGVKCTRCKRLLPVKHFYLTWHVCCFFRRLKITLDSEQPMLKEKRIILSVWGGIKGFEHF